MHNWAVDINKLKKHKKEFEIWKLEQMINYGLNGKKINKSLAKKYLSKLNIDSHKKEFLNLLIK